VTDERVDDVGTLTDGEEGLIVSISESGSGGDHTRPIFLTNSLYVQLRERVLAVHTELVKKSDIMSVWDT
jgi:hypothetical protein